MITSYIGWIPDKMAWYEPVGIAEAILLATFVSTFSEYRNENAFRRLQEEASRIRCKVYHDGVLINQFLGGTLYEKRIKSVRDYCFSGGNRVFNGGVRRNI